MTEAFRTPDERFEGLPDFPFEPHYREVDGLRVPFVASVSWVLDGVRTEYAHWVVGSQEIRDADPETH